MENNKKIILYILGFAYTVLISTILAGFFAIIYALYQFAIL